MIHINCVDIATGSNKTGTNKSDNLSPLSTQAPAQVESTQSAPEGIFTTNNTTSSCKKQPTVLLQTAWAVASSAPGSSGVTVRILFDSGSQLSYVTKRLKGQLRLKSVKIEKLHLNTFGTCHYKTQESSVLKLYLPGQTPGETIGISALTSPVICSPLPSAV